MIKKLTIRITAPEAIDFHTNMSSLLHGFLMSSIDETYADKMHCSALRPYSQHIVRNGNSWQWVISVLTDDAEDNIIKPLFQIEQAQLDHNGLLLKFSEHNITETSFDDLFVRNYISGTVSRIVTMKFITPTAFKSNGRYINYPSLKLIYSSLINKYDSSSTTTSLFDDKLIDGLLENTEIVGYNLRSTLFHLEGVKIPSFLGSIKIKVFGSSNMVSLVNMLAEFAQYSGVGIKCSLGMGGVGNFETRGKDNE